MKIRNLLGILGFCAAVSMASGLKCPIVSTETRFNHYEASCWDGTTSMSGCCTTGSCFGSFLGFLCECESQCKGWSVDLAHELSYQFKESSLETDSNVHRTYGAHDQCVLANDSPFLEAAISARVNANSCALLWEGTGCTGKMATLNGGIIPDIRIEGLSGIRSVSGCSYVAPRFKELTLYQNSFFSWFGSTEDIRVNAGECRFVGEWWKERVSMIQPKNADCFKVWDNQDCTGDSYCDCGKYQLSLGDVPKWDGTTWNNQVKALSLCNYY